MNRLIIKYIIYYLGLVLLQVLVLNNVQLSSFLIPYVYILLIIILPFETAGWLLLVIGFFLGLTMDVFPQGWTGNGATLGIHTTATVFAAFSRPFLLKWLNPRDEYEPGTTPCASDYGIRWFLMYAGLMVGIHHLVLFFVESARLTYLPEVLGRALLSAVFSLLIILIWEGFRYKRR